jgi:hypothetical protein
MDHLKVLIPTVVPIFGQKSYKTCTIHGIIVVRSYIKDFTAAVAFNNEQWIHNISYLVTRDNHFDSIFPYFKLYIVVMSDFDALDENKRKYPDKWDPMDKFLSRLTTNQVALFIPIFAVDEPKVNIAIAIH